MFLLPVLRGLLREGLTVASDQTRRRARVFAYFCRDTLVLCHGPHSRGGGLCYGIFDANIRDIGSGCYSGRAFGAAPGAGDCRGDFGSFGYLARRVCVRSHRAISPCWAQPLCFGVSYLIAKRLTDLASADMVVALLSVGVTIGLIPLTIPVWIAPTSLEVGMLIVRRHFRRRGGITQ